MFLSSQRLEDSEVCDTLGENIVLEYVRESPLFWQQYNAYEDTLSGLSQYTTSVKSALNEYDTALSNLQAAQSKLATKLLGREGGFGRCLFTKAFPSLGDLTITLHEVCEALCLQNENIDQFRTMLKDRVESYFDKISNYDLNEIKQSKKKVEKLYESLELKVGGALVNRNPPSDLVVTEISDLRKECEMGRFDLVVRLNKQECRKKLYMTQAALELLHCIKDFHRTGIAAIEEKEQGIKSIEEFIPDSVDMLSSHDILWERVRARLQGELIGAMAAPGSPPGALSPICPRPHHGIPPYSINISTEVLSNNTRVATYSDVRHARDEGVFKQGYLFAKSGMFGKKKRKWHRLYSTKLYTVDIALNQPSCTMEVVCDVSEASVSVKPGEIPYVFIIGTKEGNRLEFQAESEDEMVLWITAIRRCSTVAPGRHRSERLSITEQTSVGCLPPVKSTDGPGVQLLRQFVTANPLCCECSSEPVTWVSVSLGVTLCEPCASAHRQLTWAVSKLKNIQMDDFSEWQMKMIHSKLGNPVVNDIWEKNIPEGWDKPTKASAFEDRLKWVLAKYRWYGFVDEVHVHSDEQRRDGIMQATREGSVAKVLWWISMKGTVNFQDGAGNSPLHIAALENQPDVFAFLLLNGADVYQANNNNQTAVELAGGPAKRLFEHIVTQVQMGYY